MAGKVKFLHYPRFYGEPKLKKPKELKNIKQVFAVDYIPKSAHAEFSLRVMMFGLSTGTILATP